MAHEVTLVPGDGTGPEIAPLVQAVIREAGVAIEWDVQSAGADAVRRDGQPLPPRVLDSIRRTRRALRGRIHTPVGKGYTSPNVQLRKELNLYAGVRPIRNLPGLPARFSGVDIVMVRELTEDVYSGIEHEVVPGVYQSLKVTTEKACTRIARYAFEYARTRGRKRVTLVHKANIMKLSDGLFKRCGEAVSRDYPGIVFDTIIADNCAMQLVRNPHQFDVLLGNLFGDILSDLGAGLIGGISAAYGVNCNDDIHVFEAIHGIAPGLDGTGMCNPMPLLRPAISLLNHLGESAAGDRILHGIGVALSTPDTRTADLGGTATTREMVDAICRNMPA